MAAGRRDRQPPGKEPTAEAALHAGPREGFPRPGGSSGAVRGGSESGAARLGDGAVDSPGFLQERVVVNTCFPRNHRSTGSDAAVLGHHFGICVT